MADSIVSVIDFPVNINIVSTPPPVVTINRGGVPGISGQQGPQGTPGTGQFDSSNVVYNSGYQLITGLKDFSSGISVSYISGDSNYNGGLIGSEGKSSVDWNGRNLNDTNQTNSLDWQNRILKDGFQNYSIQYADRFLRNSAQNYVLDWNNSILSGLWLIDSGKFLNGLYSNNITSINGNINLSLLSGHTYDSSKNISLDWTGRTLISNNGNTSIDWGNYIINDSTNNTSILYGARVMVDGNNKYSIEWNNRLLRDSNQIVTIDWTHKILSGNWTQNGNNIIDSSYPIVTGISIVGSSQRLTGYVTFSAGTNDISVGQNSNGIVISAPGIGQTGSLLYNLITGISGQIIKYTTFLTSGVETEFISYPVILQSRPTTLNFSMENDRDNIIYNVSSSGITSLGFHANYSDYLSNSGYKLDINILV